MRIAVDTNVLVAHVNGRDPHNVQVSSRLDQLNVAKTELCIAPQVIYEFWVSATRPIEVNGLGLSPELARLHIQTMLRAFVLLRDPDDLLERWLELCSRSQVRGRRAHDARIAAWMLSHGIVELLTFNHGDFAGFDEIRVVAPH